MERTKYGLSPKIIGRKVERDCTIEEAGLEVGCTQLCVGPTAIIHHMKAHIQRMLSKGIYEKELLYLHNLRY
jgi:hypothetical protein